MTVLSDATLREHIRQGSLIVDGDVSAAIHCAYEFKAGKVTFGGERDGRVNSIDLSSEPSASVQPTAVVWVRSRVRVKIPTDLVGIWIQTNSLSRRGMLLLNSTLVEPGYEGFLSAHLVNLGANVVTLGPDTTIAKLLFMRLDRPAEEAIDSSKFSNYDAFIESLAAGSNPSFLRMNELTHDLRKHLSAVLAETENRARGRLEKLGQDTQENVAQHLTQEKNKIEEDLKRVEKNTLWRVGGGFVTGLALALALLAWVLPKYRAVDAESEARIRAIVEAANAQRDRELEALGQKIEAQLDRASTPPDSAQPHPSPEPSSPVP